jgi:type VI secretion system protein ImpK
MRAAAAPSASRSQTAEAFPWRMAGAAVAVLAVLALGYKIFSPAPAPTTSPIAAVEPPAVVAPAAPVAAPTTPSVAPVAPVAAPAAPAAEPVAVKAVAPALSARQLLEKELAAEIGSGLVRVGETAGRTSITLGNARQFASGAIEPSADVQAVLGRIGQALDAVPGPILVRGYADSVPVKPGTFASNEDLSAARAKAAAAAIAPKLAQQQRIASEGAGEADPIAPNDTEDNRAKNRRIAIFLGPRT